MSPPNPVLLFLFVQNLFVNWAAVLYVTPERLQNSVELMALLLSLQVRDLLRCIAFDEAHCISEMGHDYRPAYLSLEALLRRFRGIPVLAMTATANDDVQADIRMQLGLQDPVVVIGPLDRSNIAHRVVLKDGPSKVCHQIVSLAREHSGACGIVYCMSRAGCQDVAAQLDADGFRVAVYHAGLDQGVRESAHTDWIRGDVDIMVATVAFGVGIDKQDVRFVVHATLPKSVSAYEQGSGRAGRDGLASWSYVLYCYNDSARLQRLIASGSLAPQQLRRQLDNLSEMVALFDDHSCCRMQQLRLHRSEPLGARCGAQNACDVCSAGLRFQDSDVSGQVRLLIRLVGSTTHTFTLRHIADVFRGLSTPKVKVLRHNRAPAFGAGKAFATPDVDRLVRLMVRMDVLVEVQTWTQHNRLAVYVKAGPNAGPFERSGTEIIMSLRL